MPEQIDYSTDLEDLPVGIVKSHFLDSGSFTLWTKAAEYAKSSGLGEWAYYDTEEFWDYCVVPETKVLRSDLVWAEAGSLKIGDSLLGFDEYQQADCRGRRWRESIVTSYKEQIQPCYKLTFDDGTSVTCTAEHKWLSGSQNYGKEWLTTEEMRVCGERSSSVVKALPVWETDKSWSGGYLAAAFDGEGSIHMGGVAKKAAGGVKLDFAQKKNHMMREVIKCLSEKGYSFSEYQHDTTEVCHLYLKGGLENCLRFLGSVRPRRLLGKFDCSRLGLLKMRRKTHRVKLVEKLEVGEQRVCVIRTDTKTFLANGLCSHNCDDYAKFIKKYAVGIDHYANVDAIPNPKLTWRNQKYLEEEHGLSPVPVVHYKTDLKWLRRYVESGYEFIALGGLVGSTSQEDCRRWIDDCFDYVCDTPTRLPKVRLHGFGVTTYSLLLRYPWYSVDSTSWTKIGAYGGILIPHKRGGKWVFTEEPYRMKVSLDSPDLAKKGKHYHSMSTREKEIIQEWLDFIQVPLGRMGKDGEVAEYGVTTRHTERRAANLHFFELMRRSLPTYPWPFRSTKIKGFGIGRK